MYFFIGFIIWLSFVSVFHVLNDFLLMFFISNTLSVSFLLTKANPPFTVRAKIVISPSINDEFYLGAFRVIIIIFIKNFIIITTNSIMISLDLLTGGIKLVGGTRGWEYCIAMQYKPTNN